MAKNSASPQPSTPRPPERAGNGENPPMNMQTLAMFSMVATAVGGIAYVFLYPLISGERKIDQRRENVTRKEPVTRAVRANSKVRREQVAETLKELEIRARRSNNPPLSVRIEQAGLTCSKTAFVSFAAVLGLLTLLVVFVVSTNILIALLAGFAAGCGVPLWVLRFLKKRRQKKFLDGFPDAVDVIVRGIKSGLPLLDSMRIISTEAQEPLKSEFKAIIESQAVGVPIGDACVKMYERMPLAEANFFGIAIAIQQKAGGNLSEALGNLSRVLRERKKMKGKINAMSMEAKASAAIIGSLPIVVGVIVYLTSPDYIQLLWTTGTGRMMMALGAIWMSLGIVVMKQMINFDF
jgi:tight adherence protein B